jgi:alpha-tubulin suppressor-like RCC1 family protein
MQATRTALVFLLLSVGVSIPVAHAGQNSGIRSIYSGPAANETCVVMADRRAYCWGETPNPLPAINTDIAELVIGHAFRCALTTAGTVYCWGHNESGQLGDGTFAGRDIPQPVQYGGGDLSRISAITAGQQHACALRDGAVWCWGNNSVFQIGNYLLPARTNAQLPLQVFVHQMTSSPPLDHVAQISAGDFHTCALLADNTGACWGNGHDGELGNGTFGANSNSPLTVKVDSGGLVTLVMGGAAISSGDYTSCGLIADVITNSVGCWGLNNHGQLGIGNTSDRASAVPAQDERGKIVDAVAIAVGGSAMCAIVVDSTVRCWGSDASWQLSLAAVGADQNRGVRVLTQVGVPLKWVIKIVAGAQHFCALTLGETVYCWGDNTYGQVGQRFGQKFDVPTLIAIDTPMFTDNFDGE